MLVHIALKESEGSNLAAAVGDSIRRAAMAVFDEAGEGYFQIVTEQAVGAVETPAGNGGAVVALIYPRARYGARKKRELFGRIGEALERELRIARKDIVLGVIEAQEGNWMIGGEPMTMDAMMAGRLP